MAKDTSACFPVHGEEGSAWPSPEQVSSVLLFGSLGPSTCHVSTWMLQFGDEAGLRCIQEKEENFNNFYAIQTETLTADSGFVSCLSFRYLKDGGCLFNLIRSAVRMWLLDLSSGMVPVRGRQPLLLTINCSELESRGSLNSSQIPWT